MDGPFKVTRNKWQETPLERIQRSIDEIKEEIKTKKLKSSDSGVFQDLSKTLKTLGIEKEKLIIKVRELKIKRGKLINELTFIRKEKFETKKKEKIKGICEKINKIDEDLGPFRHFDTPIYLE